MLTESTGAAGAPGAAKDMAEYLAKESHVAGLSDKLAAYYGYGLMSDEGYTTAGIPQRDMHPSIAGLLKIDPSKPLSTMEMAHLLAGQCADGSDIPGKQKQTKNKIRISYIDFTLSAPKSLSLAISLATAEGMHAEAARLDNCHTIAVDKTLKLIAEAVGTVSKGDTSKNFKRDKGHVAIVKFEHNTARPVEKIGSIENGIHVTKLKDVGANADMNRHTHGIMMAVAITDEGRVGSVHQQATKGRIHEWGSLYQAFLATELRRIGVETELDSRKDIDFNGRMARLTAIPQRISDLFSKRTTNGREAARQHAAKNGLDYDAMSADEKSEYIDVMMNATKKKKGDGVDPQAWRAEAKAAGFTYRSVLRPGQERDPVTGAERHKRVYETSLPLLETQFGKRSVVEGAVARVAAAKGFIEHGINDASELNAITAAYRTEGVRQDGEMTSVHFAFDPAERYARITTQLSVDQESEAIGILKKAADDKSVALSPAAVQRAVDVVSAKGYNFTEGHGLKQREVIDQLAAAGRASVAVGIAGSGKTTLLMPLVEAWHQKERDVYGVTLGWRQTTGLKDAGIGWKHKKKKPSIEPNADTLVSAGVDESKTYAMTGFLARLNAGILQLTPNSVVVIDEIALVGTKQILALARHQKEQGFQIVGIGDDKQGQSIAAGATIDLMRRAFGADNVPELISTVRQHKERDRETSLLFREGKAEEALLRKDEDGTVKIIAGGYEEAVNATVDLWFERKAATQDREGYTLGISVPTNADGLAIGQEIHRRRMASGEIKPPICEIDAEDQNGAKFPLSLSIGDSVRLFDRVFGKDAEGHNGFVGNNGTVVEVVGADAKHLIVRKPSGGIASVEWDDLKEDAYERRKRKREGLPPPEKESRIRLTRGDAITIDARQSETLTEHITAMPRGSSLVNGFKAYVAESRQREMSWIIASQGAEMMEVQRRRAIGDPRNEDADPANIKADILKNLGRNLSRQPTKTLATDFMERSVHLRSGSVGAMRAAWHRQETRQAEDKPPLATAARIEAKAETNIQIPELTPAFEAERFGPPVESAPPTVTTVKPQERPAMSAADIQMGFAEALVRDGFRLKGSPTMDGQWHRVAVDGDKGAQKSGSYRGWATGGIMHNFRGGEAITWRPDGLATSMTAEQRAAQQAADRAARLQAQADRQAMHDKVATDAEAAWKAAKPAHPDHAYLKRKQINGKGLKQGAAGQTVPMKDGKEIGVGGKLLVPLRDDDGKLWNLQVIDKDGGKLFLPGRKKGLSFTSGDIKPNAPLIIAEGMATAKTLYNTTSLTTIAAIDSGNILAVAERIRAKYPDNAIILAADNDHHLPRKEKPTPNVGIAKATDAAAQVGGVVIAPQFTPDDKGTDWNDVHVDQGRVAVRKQIEAAFAAQGIAELLPAERNIRSEAWRAAEPSISNATMRRQEPTERLNPTQGV